MRIDVCLTPAELAAHDVSRAAVAVIDVLRATSTIVEALANGAKSVMPVATPEEATSLLQRIGGEDVLRCGERRGERIDGFDLGNSPQEFTAARVGGKFLAMTTTNGTPALVAAAGAKRTLVASFLNLNAVAAALASEERVVLLCAGREGRFALEDGLCAGALVRALQAVDPAATPNDAALAASALAASAAEQPVATLRSSAAGRSLDALGLAEDVEFCARTDRHTVVPVYRERRVTVTPGFVAQA